MAIERRTLRSQVREELLAKMRAGDVEPGEGINEVQLAAELGVSRTPLREALIALESEGQIQSENGKGFRFAPLSAVEFRELAPVIAVLEGLAIELSPPDELALVGKQLARLAAEFAEEIVVHALVTRRDDEWHGLMVSCCPNERLMDLIAGVRLAIHRYESLLVPDEATIARNASEHADIARHIVAGDIALAKEALKVNWVNGVNRLLQSTSAT